jgi:hypothetical protein
MIKKAIILLIIILLAPINTHAEEYRNVEIFNISEGRVVSVVKSNPIIQKEVTEYLLGIVGVYAKSDPIPTKGYAIKIPLDPSIKIENKWLNSVVDEAIIMFPDEDGPEHFLMIFENENKLVCFTFKGNTKLLLKDLNFEINSSK